MSARVARVARHMSLAKASIMVFVVVALLTTVFMIKMTQGQALHQLADGHHRAYPTTSARGPTGP